MTTRVDFHSQITDKMAYACRLIRKARAAQCQIVVLGENAQDIAALDLALWEFSRADFLPHVVVTPQSTQHAQHAPILLTENLAQAGQHKELLINLSQSFPAGYQGFQRVIELVSKEERDATAGRQRFRQYQQDGIKPDHLIAN